MSGHGKIFHDHLELQFTFAKGHQVPNIDFRH